MTTELVEISCSKCNRSFNKRVGKHGRRCQACKAEWRRSYLQKMGYGWRHGYEKTKNGFLMRLYRNMKSRVTGIHRVKFHLYKGKELLDKEVFYTWAKDSKKFHRLFKDWEMSGYQQSLTPSVDRIDPTKGYMLDNMEWVTHSENSRRGAVSWMRKYYEQWRRDQK